MPSALPTGDRCEDDDMALDPRCPVIVGVAQVTDRVGDPAVARTALELMNDACQSAAIDAGQASMIADLDLIAVVGGLWSYPDPGSQLADTLGATNAASLLTGLSGTSPLRLLDHLADQIAHGVLSSAVMVGGEVFRSRRRSRRLGTEVRRDIDSSLSPAERYEGSLEMATPHEESRGLVEPAVFYPVVETAIRHARGETVEQHRQRIGELWSRFNAVAVDNPHAATRTPMSADEITIPSAKNRMIAAPYTKAMMANNSVDQAGAILITSAGRAEELGLTRNRWVFPWVCTRADDPASPSERMHLHRSAAARTAGRRVLEAANLQLEEIGHLDLYACFPSSVQVCATELGLDTDNDPRPLTANGGLTFAGAPHSSSVTQSLSAMVERLRNTEGTGLLYANGGYLGKHAFGVYATEPPLTGYRSLDCKSEMANEPVRNPDPDFVGKANIDGYTVRYNRDGEPIEALVAALTPDEARVWGRSDDHMALDALMANDAVGWPCELDLGGRVAL